MTTTLINKDSRTIVLVDNNELDLNDVFHLNYNFDVLKKILTTLLSSQKANEEEISNLNKNLEAKDKMIGNLELKLINSIRILSEKIEDKSKEIEDMARSSNEKNSNSSKDTIKKLEDKIANLTNKVDLLEKSDANNKENIRILEEKLNGIIREDISEVRNGVKNIIKDNEEINNKTDILDSKIQRFEKNIIDLTAKFNEINIFEIMKNFENKDGGNDNSNTNNNGFLIMLEGVKLSLNQKIDYIDQKFEALQNNLAKFKTENINLVRKVDSVKEKQDEHQKNIENINNDLNNIFKILKGNLSIASVPTPKNIKKEIFKENEKDNSKNSVNVNNDNNNNSNSNKAIDNIMELIGDINSRLQLLEDELNKKGNDESNSNNNYNNNNISTNTNTNTNNNSSNTSNTLDPLLKNKLADLEKQIKIINVKEKDREDNFNKKILNLTEILKKKGDKEEIQNAFDDIESLKRRFENHLDEFNLNIDKKIPEEFSWLKKKIESLTNSLNDMKSNFKPVNTKEKDIDFYMNEAFSNGKYVEINSFNDFKQAIQKEFATYDEKMNQLTNLVDDMNLIISQKCSMKDLKNLEGKFNII